MTDDTNPRARATGALAEIFLEAAASAGDFGSFEREALRAGHACMAEAIGIAPEALDARLLARKRRGLRVHDVRTRTLATEVGDVAFSIRRFRDEFGRDVYPLADRLDIPYGRRISPGAAEFLVEAAERVSYAKASAPLARNGSKVSPAAVMGCVREAGALCAEQDEAAARSLYADGVLPGGAEACEELCVEADGTYFSTQKCPPGTPRRVEVKAMVAYAGKEGRGGKVRRRGCVRHALVGGPGELWSQGVAAVGERCDLAKVRRVRLGADGEPWCGGAGRYFPLAETAFRLDPFHVNRAVMACLPDRRMAWSVIDVINDGGEAEAVALLRACLDLGVANAGRAGAVIRYLEGNAGAIAVDGPSLGTMESENQHLYGARMDCWPCAWSLRGASDMARLISRRASGRAVPRMTRERSEGGRRRERRERKELAFHERRGRATIGREGIPSSAPGRHAEDGPRQGLRPAQGHGEPG